jgi:isopenicillin-N epimerase
MAANRALALEARSILCAALGAPPAAPASMIGAIASVPLPAPAPGSPAAGLDHEGLMNWFRARGVETWLYAWPCAGGKLLRVSAQLYNTRDEYTRLASLLLDALG